MSTNRFPKQMVETMFTMAVAMAGLGLKGLEPFDSKCLVRPGTME